MASLKDIKVNINVDTTDFIKSLRQLQEIIKMKKMYLVMSDLDVDGGFGDAIPTKEPVKIYYSETLANRYVKEHDNPRIYDRSYADLYEGGYHVEEIEVGDLDINRLCKRDLRVAKDLHIVFQELNSKIIMPKFFGDWAKTYNTYTDSGLNNALKNLFDIYTTGVYENGIEGKLNTWIQENNTSERYIKCTKALIAGYEVEK